MLRAELNFGPPSSSVCVVSLPTRTKTEPASLLSEVSVRRRPVGLKARILLAEDNSALLLESWKKAAAA
jgi:hypothetical protein